jgi:two-component system, sensor histidine kinase and response regulator
MPSQGAPAQPTILLVEDDQATREMCALLLRTEGFRVDVASGGRRALDLAMRRRYELIVRDLRLPTSPGSMS